MIPSKTLSNSLWVPELAFYSNKIDEYHNITREPSFSSDGSRCRDPQASLELSAEFPIEEKEEGLYEPGEPRQEED